MRQEIFCRMIFVTEVFLWTVIFYPFCVEAGTCDYLKLWILVPLLLISPGLSGQQAIRRQTISASDSCCPIN